MARYNAPTRVTWGPRVTASGTFTATGTSPPFWDAMPPSGFNQAQGTSIDFNTMFHSPSGFPRTYSVGSHSAYNQAALASRGLTLGGTGNSLLQISSSATQQTTAGITILGDDGHGGVVESPAFDVIVTGSTASFGTWNGRAVLTIVQGQTIDLLAGTSPWLSGQNNVTLSIQGSLPSGVSNPPNSLTLVATSTATVTPRPSIYLTLRQQDSGGNINDCPLRVSLCVARSTPVQMQIIRGGSPFGSPFADTAFNSQTFQNNDIIEGTPGVIAASTASWIPKSNMTLTVRCSVSGEFMVKDGGGLKAVVASHGGGTAPTNCTMDISGVWIRGTKPDNSLIGDPSSMGGAFNLTGVLDGTQKWKIHDNVLEDCVQAIFTADSCGDVEYHNNLQINCGVNFDPNCHGFYVSCTLFDWRGNDVYWTYNQSQLPTSRSRWACGGHDAKTRSQVNYFSGGRIRSAALFGGSSNTSEKINFAGGGICYVNNVQIEENQSSESSVIIGYHSTGDWPVNELHVLQNTIVNNGKTSEQFLSFRQNFNYTIVPSTTDIVALTTQLGVNTTNGHLSFQVISGGPTYWAPGPPARLVSQAGTIWNDGMSLIMSFSGGGAIGGITPSGSGAPMTFYYLKLLSYNAAQNQAIASLHPTRADALAGTNALPLATASAGSTKLIHVPTVWRYRDNALLGTTGEDTPYNSDGTTFAATNLLAAVSRLQDPDPLTGNFAITNPPDGTQTWTDPTGASDYYNPKP